MHHVPYSDVCIVMQTYNACHEGHSMMHCYVVCFVHTETSVTLYPVGLLLEWQLPLGLQLEECSSVWRRGLHSGTRPSLGEQ